MRRPAAANKFSGDYTGGATPVPIPNTVVKPSKADGTARVTVWESRSSPGINSKKPALVAGFFICSADLAFEVCGPFL
jgi:hypothetical protein